MIRNDTAFVMGNVRRLSPKKKRVCSPCWAAHSAPQGCGTSKVTGRTDPSVEVPRTAKNWRKHTPHRVAVGDRERIFTATVDRTPEEP
jgi:hypothetical protein